MGMTGFQRRRRRKAKREREKQQENKLTLDDLEQKEGGWYIFPDESKAHGKEKAKEKLAEWNEGD